MDDKRQPILTDDGKAMVIALVVTAAFLFPLITGGVVLFQQIVGWLKTGIWIPQTLADGIARLGYNPTTDWVGFNSILQSLPPAGTLIIGAFLMWAWVIGSFK
ncbi:hypothetical protein [Rhizobium sp.]|jgi:hypothetical protein|uniref:hypothetical protein n=1 Tax=Rhizobium sp. TaxID=391 RepID=UPI002AA6F14F